MVNLLLQNTANTARYAGAQVLLLYDRGAYAVEPALLRLPLMLPLLNYYFEVRLAGIVVHGGTRSTLKPPSAFV